MKLFQTAIVLSILSNPLILFADFGVIDSLVNVLLLTATSVYIVTLMLNLGISGGFPYTRSTHDLTRLLSMNYLPIYSATYLFSVLTNFELIRLLLGVLMVVSNSYVRYVHHMGELRRVFDGTYRRWEDVATYPGYAFRGKDLMQSDLIFALLSAYIYLTTTEFLGMMYSWNSTIDRKELVVSESSTLLFMILLPASAVGIFTMVSDLRSEYHLLTAGVILFEVLRGFSTWTTPIMVSVVMMVIAVRRYFMTSGTISVVEVEQGDRMQWYALILQLSGTLVLLPARAVPPPFYEPVLPAILLVGFLTLFLAITGRRAIVPAGLYLVLSSVILLLPEPPTVFYGVHPWYSKFIDGMSLAVSVYSLLIIFLLWKSENQTRSGVE